MRKVWVVGGDSLTEDMFTKRGWQVVTNPDEADLIQFTGGEDVSPHLYGQAKHPTTYNNPNRDDYEADIFNYVGNDKPKAGICRGAQFLNVMSGGSMYQDVDGHLGLHLAYPIAHPEIDDWAEIIASGSKPLAIDVTSTHHQMMIPSEKAEILMVAYQSTYRDTASYRDEDATREDYECVYYPETKSLCYQPHPEYMEIEDDCQEMYFYLIREYLGISEEDFNKADVVRQEV